jgi:hypothetical protein
MANDVLNVLAGKPLATGGVLRDPASSTGLPTDATTPLVGPTALGYIGEDGLTETIDRSTDKVKAWGGDVVKVVQTDFSVSYGFTFYESINADVLKAVHGDENVDLTPATAAHGNQTVTKINSTELPKSEWFFEVRDGQAKIRIYVPIGQITAVGEVNYNDGAVIGYPVTLEAFPDADGNQAYKMTDDGRKTSA